MKIKELKAKLAAMPDEINGEEVCIGVHVMTKDDVDEKIDGPALTESVKWLGIRCDLTIRSLCLCEKEGDLVIYVA